MTFYPQHDVLDLSKANVGFCFSGRSDGALLRVANKQF